MENDFDLEALLDAVAGNHIDLLKEMFSPKSPCWFKKVMFCSGGKLHETAAEHGCVEILEWLWGEELTDQTTCRKHAGQMLVVAARNGYYQIIEWLIQKKVIVMYDCLSRHYNVLSNAAATGQIAVLEWMKRNGWASAAHCRMHGNDALQKALSCGQIDAANWLMAQGLDRKDCEELRDLFHIILCAETTALVDWLWRRELIPPHFHECIREGSYLAWRKKTDLLDWSWLNGLLTKEHCLSDDDLVSKAAERGNLEMLKWLKNAVPEINLRARNFKALRTAATLCHVDTAKWLAKESEAKLSNFYSVELLSMACKSVAMLEWLHSCGGCTTEDFDKVLRFADKPDSVRWIAQHTDLSLFKKHGMEEIWQSVWQVQIQLKMLILVVAGRRKRVRLPPELMEFIAANFCAF